jgi:hypothetical protein
VGPSKGGSRDVVVEPDSLEDCALHCAERMALMGVLTHESVAEADEELKRRHRDIVVRNLALLETLESTCSAAEVAGDDVIEIYTSQVRSLVRFARAYMKGFL